MNAMKTLTVIFALATVIFAAPVFADHNEYDEYGRKHGHWTESDLVSAAESESASLFIDFLLEPLREEIPDLKYKVSSEGRYVHGKRSGLWVIREVLRDVDGTVIEGPYVDGKKHGHWVERGADGSVREGVFVDGKKHGYWVNRYSDGSGSESPYVDGKRHGHWVERDDRNVFGYVREGPYVKGKEHGHWITRYVSGSVAKGPFVDGKKHGHWVLRAYGLVVAEGPFVDGKQHGRWFVQPPNGDSYYACFENGNPVGC